MNGATVLLRATSAADHQFVDRARELAVCLARQRMSEASAERVAVTTHELVDNAVRYATGGSFIVLEVVDYGGEITIQVENDASERRRTMLLRRLHELGVGSAPRGLGEQAPAGATTMLGLSRVAREAQMRLSVRVFADRVTITAVGRMMDNGRAA